ncbi:MAG: DUF4381 domain-containing protein [Thiogranum sp.]
MAGSIPSSQNFGNRLLYGIDEVQLPPPVELWPSAPGWKYVGLVLLAVLLFAIYRLGRRWWQNRYRRAALQELALLREKDKSSPDLLLDLATLIKATALQIYPRTEIATLTGSDWYDYLNRAAGKTLFDSSSKQFLGVAVYRSGKNSLAENEINHLFEQVHAWLKQHPLPVKHAQETES